MYCCCCCCGCCCCCDGAAYPPALKPAGYPDIVQTDSRRQDRIRNGGRRRGPVGRARGRKMASRSGLSAASSGEVGRAQAAASGLGSVLCTVITQGDAGVYVIVRVGWMERGGRGVDGVERGAVGSEDSGFEGFLVETDGVDLDLDLGSVGPRRSMSMALDIRGRQKRETGNGKGTAGLACRWSCARGGGTGWMSSAQGDAEMGSVRQGPRPGQGLGDFSGVSTHQLIGNSPAGGGGSSWCRPRMLAARSPQNWDARAGRRS